MFCANAPRKSRLRTPSKDTSLGWNILVATNVNGDDEEREEEMLDQGWIPIDTDLAEAPPKVPQAQPTHSSRRRQVFSRSASSGM